MIPTPLKTPRFAQHSTSSWLGVLALGFLATGCGAKQETVARVPPKFTFPVVVQVTDESAQPLAGVPVDIMLGKEGTPKTVGHTDRSGEFKALIDAEHETPVTVMLGTLAGYTLAPGDGIAEETLFAKRDEQDQLLIHTNTVALSARLTSSRIEHLVWVALDCPKDGTRNLCENITIAADGKLVATTDPDGRAHFILKEVVGKQVNISIDNTVPISEEDLTQLMPADPEYSITLPKEPAVFAIRDTFTRIDEKRKPSRPVKKPATTKPATTKPATTKPATTKPATTKPATTKPVTGKPAIDFGKADPPKKDPPKKDPPKSTSKKDPIELF